MKKICVLLSTYNGERFLKKQLDTLAAQSDEGLEVLIYARDDGSKDSTPQILQEYFERGVVTKILSSAEGNLGFADSFYRLVEGADDSCDYYAFCDQDDLWDADKLKCAAAILDGMDNTKPALTFGTYRIINGKDEVIGKKGMKKFKHRPEYAFEDMFSMNHTYGCTCTFNAAARRAYLKYEIGEIRFHDWTINVICSALGNVVYDPEPHMGYRLHENNAFGPARLTRKSIKRFFSYNKKYEFNNTRLIEMKLFCSHFYDELDEQKKALADLILNYKDKKGGKRALLKYKRYWKKPAHLKILNWFQVVTGKL